MSATPPAPVAASGARARGADAATAPLAFGRRFLAALATWTLLVLATPGCLTPAGSALLASVALVPWGLACARPGRRAFLAEFLAAFCGMTGVCWWVSYVWVGTLLTVGVMPAVWIAAAGVVLRRLARVLPLWVAVPLAWAFGDALRHAIEPPFSFGWMRLGFHLHDWPVLAGSARVWGPGGLTLVLAAVAGGICSTIMRKDAGARRLVPLALGLLPGALAALLAAVTAPPATVDGPRLLLVQPGIEQVRKQSASASEILAQCVRTTRAGLADAAGAPLDAVCWGETMLPVTVFEPGLEERMRSGVTSPPWEQPPLTAEDVAEFRERGDALVDELFFGSGRRGAGLVPAGASFLSGAETYLARDGWVRRANAVFLWDAEGRRGPAAAKRHLVPGGETMLGLERWEWVRDAAFAIAGYLPDLVASEETTLLELAGRDGRRWTFGASVCFDNLYDDVYVDPLRAGRRVDFHLVCSNEAWFRTSWEMDQMVAFSKLIALSSGRAVVRVTNSGVTCLLGPDGRERARFRDAAGEDRGVAGALTVVVPVPAAGDEAPATLFARTAPGWVALWILLPLLLGLALRKQSVTTA